MRRTKIICTLGPSSNTPERIRQLIEAGMDVARLNFSHGTHEQHQHTYTLVREIADDVGRNVAILMDLQGPKIRTGALENGKPVFLEDGASFTITTEPVTGTASRVSTTYTHLAQDVKPGNRILISDGLIELRVEQVQGSEIHCRVIHGGTLGEHKGINLPGVAVSEPCLTEKDLDDLRFGLELDIDYVALSFVRTPDDIRSIKGHIADAGKEMRVVAKIERPEALECFDEILALTDAVMVARGDLGVEIPLHEVPQVQKDLIRRCNLAGKPVITATQMLESMVTAPRPTRAEVNDVANAIYDGTDAVMLSGETASGAFPVEAVRTMSRISEETDRAIALHPKLRRHSDWAREITFSGAISHAAAQIAEDMDVRCIVCFTSSGYTASRIAQYRPAVPVHALTLSEAARRRCALFWGVDAVTSVEAHNHGEMMRLVEREMLSRKLVEKGDTIVVIAGEPLAVAGRTNLIRLHQIGDEGEIGLP